MQEGTIPRPPTAGADQRRLRLPRQVDAVRYQAFPSRSSRCCRVDAACPARRPQPGADSACARDSTGCRLPLLGFAGASERRWPDERVGVVERVLTTGITGRVAASQGAGGC